MSARQKLSNRRLAETFNFQCNGLDYVATVGRFDNGDVAEIFLNNSKAGSHSDASAKDAAVITSLALQFRVPLEVIRHAVLRDSNGNAASPIGCAIDLIIAGSS